MAPWARIDAPVAPEDLDQLLRWRRQDLERLQWPMSLGPRRIWTGPAEIWGFPARKMGVSPIARWRVYFHGKIPIEKMGDDVWGTPMTSRKPPSYGMVDG